MRRKRERAPELPPDAGSTAHHEDAPAPPAEEAQPSPRGGLLGALRESLREAALRRTSTKR